MVQSQNQWQVHGYRNTTLRNRVMVKTQASSGYFVSIKETPSPVQGSLQLLQTSLSNYVQLYYEWVGRVAQSV
jgi:hypothetical protein